MLIVGYAFTTKVSLCQGVSPLAAKGKKATYDCVRVFRKFSELTRQTFFKMFDVQIQPIVLYGSEVLGLQRIDVIEKVHTFACKHFVNVPLKTPNKMVYGDLGRYPLFVNSCIIIIINPLTARVVGAPQMILQPVFSIFPCSPLPSGTCRTPGLSIP